MLRTLRHTFAKTQCQGRRRQTRYEPNIFFYNCEPYGADLKDTNIFSRPRPGIAYHSQNNNTMLLGDNNIGHLTFYLLLTEIVTINLLWEIQFTLDIFLRHFK